MVGVVTAVSVIGVLNSALGSPYQAYKASKQQKNLNNQAEARAVADAQAADRAFNAANGKKPDLAALLTGNKSASGLGVGGTMLTGPGGVDPGSMLLGKKTLLGG
jgi:hypothetical protein